MSTKKQTGLRLDTETYEAVKKAAEENGRSINNQIVQYIRQALAVRPT